MKCANCKHNLSFHTGSLKDKGTSCTYSYMTTNGNNSCKCKCFQSSHHSPATKPLKSQIELAGVPCGEDLSNEDKKQGFQNPLVELKEKINPHQLFTANSIINETIEAVEKIIDECELINNKPKHEGDLKTGLVRIKKLKQKLKEGKGK